MMEPVLGLIIIAQVLVMGLILVGYFHEEKLVAFEDRVFAILKARHIAAKRARARAYLKKTAPQRSIRPVAPKALRVIRGGRYHEDVA